MQYSFQINTIWHHVTMNGSVGTDQQGNRWSLRNGKLYSEFSYHIIDPNEEIEIIREREMQDNAFANEIFEREEGL